MLAGGMNLSLYNNTLQNNTTVATVVSKDALYGMLLSFALFLTSTLFCVSCLICFGSTGAPPNGKTKKGRLVRVSTVDVDQAEEEEESEEGKTAIV